MGSPLHEQLDQNSLIVESLSPKGKGLSSDHKWEVIGALPGEEVVVQLGGKKKKKRIGILQEILRSSPNRVAPKCVHSPRCGGCAFQHLSYSKQLAHKEELIRQYFKEIFIKDEPQIRPILGCEYPWEYRNKMEFSFSEDRKGEKYLGLLLAAGKGRVETVSRCHLASKWFSDVLNAVYNWWKGSSLSAYHFRSDQGHLRTLTIREAKQGTGKMVMLTVSGNPAFALKKKDLDAFVEAVQAVTKDGPLSVFVQVHQIAKGKPTQFFEMLLSGPDHITEVLHVFGEKMECKISPTSFFQPNTLQAQKIFTEGISMLSNLEGALVFDLYCGGATFGLIAAKRAKQVVGIEMNPHSVFDAGWNQEVNQVENFSIFQGDVGKVLEEMRKQTDFQAPEVVIVDPPRCGLDPAAIQHILSLSPKEILYVSCNPKTQAENILELQKGGYRLAILQPVDQFPHTVHMENIVLLQKP